MKHIKLSVLFIASIFAITACSDDNNKKEQMTNGLDLSISGNAFMSEDDTNGITIKAFLAFTPDKEKTVELVVTGNEDDIVRIENTVLTFKPGQKEATIKVLSNAKHALSVPRTISLAVGKTSDPMIKAVKKDIKITINPDSDVPVLTQEQLKLIAGYKEKYGIDVSRILGKIAVEAVVTFNTEDKETYFNGEAQKTFKGYTIITLSQKATADTPILKMTDNPMGLTSFFYSVLKRKTVEDTEFFLATPYGNAAVKAIKYDPAKETFTASLDSIKLVPATQSINFLVHRNDIYGYPIIGLAFDYTFSAWDRLLALKEKGTVVEIEEGGKLVGYKIDDDFLTMGGSIAPQRWLAVSDVSRDTCTHTPTDWIQPTASYDFTKGTMTFIFPWDFDGANGYEQVRVTYTMHK